VIKDILITGGAGFIGSNLALLLVSRGHKVRVLDNLAPQIHGVNPETSPLLHSIKGRVEFLLGSVTSESDLIKALDDIDTVVHFAAETGTGQSMYAIQHYSDVNIGGTALLLDLIANKKFPVKKIIVASSRAIYGEGKYYCQEHEFVYPSSRLVEDMENGDFDVHCPSCRKIVELVPTDETTPVCPSSVYGITKLTQEQMVLTVGKALGISAIALRYQNVYGPGQSLSNPYTGILSIFATRMRNGNGINIFEDGKESRDFLFIDDAVTATVNAIDYDPPIIESFNVGSGLATNVVTIVKNMQDSFATSVSTEITGQFRVGDIRHNVADLSKIKSILGFKPKVSIETGMKKFIDWVNMETIQDDKYDQSLNELREKGLLKTPSL
jgi:dTDP-L-rhamnose 4-epimerase